MKKSKRFNRKIDIHSAGMVKTIFVLGSVAILAFLIMVAKYTTFTSEPKAGYKNKVVPKNKAALRLSCYTKFTEDYLKQKGFSSSDVKSMVNDINTASVAQNSNNKVIKSYLNPPACDFNYTHVGDAGVSTRYRCCVSNEYINSLTLKKMNTGGGNSNNTSGALAVLPTSTPVPEGSSVTNCGANHINCSAKYGNYVPNNDNTLSYTVLCAKDGSQPAGKGYRCAINMGGETYCDGTKISLVNSGGAADVMNYNRTSVSYRVCWLK